jgi:hypothetical protein
MGPPMRMGRCAAVLAAATLTAGLAGCGSVHYRAATTAAHRQDPGPVAGSRALALASARRLLDALVLPAGSRPLPQRPFPAGLDQPGVSGLGAGILLDVDRLYRLRLTESAAIDFLKAHRPAGTTGADFSGGGGAGGVTSTAIADVQRRVPAGIDVIYLIETLVPEAGGTSALRTDAEVTWYPPRSAAEYLIASRFRLVTIALTSASGTASIAGGQRLIRPLVLVLDSMHATPPLDFPCSSGMTSYRLTFAPAVRGQAAVVVASGSCGADTVTVGGRAQPDLADLGPLSAVVTRLVRDHAHN